MTNERRSSTPSLLAPRRKGSAARDGYTTGSARGVDGARCRSRKDLNLGLGPIGLAERDSTDFAFINTIPPAVGSLCFRIRTGERHRSLRAFIETDGRIPDLPRRLVDITSTQIEYSLATIGLDKRVSSSGRSAMGSKRRLLSIIAFGLFMTATTAAPSFAQQAAGTIPNPDRRD